MNMGKGVELTGKNQEKIYPITASDLVYDKDTKKNMKQTLGEKVEEAPNDGKQYARQNGTWAEVEAGAVSETALITLLPNESGINGATVKVTTDDGQTLLDTTWQGSVLSVQVRAGLNYTVTVGDKDGYIAPSAVTYTAVKGATRTISMTYTASTLKLNILSNQGTSDSAISGVKATVKYGSTTVQMGNGEKINLPLNTTVTITFPAVTNYKAPSSISFTHTGGAVEKTGTYQTEVVTVTLSADNGASVSGQKVTINGTTHTWNGTAITQKVAFGTSYSVSVDAKSGYTTPSAQSFTASQSGRNCEFIYHRMPGTLNPGSGIYIQLTNGYYLTPNEWDDSYGFSPNGVAVITENCSFVIALENAHQSDHEWGVGEEVVPGVVSTDSEAEAILDYNGETETTTIINYLKGKEDEWGLVGAPAAEYCRAYIFPNGQTGYLGAAGEWKAVLDNADKIEFAMLQTGGDSIKQFYWTATQGGLEWQAWAADINKGILKQSLKSDYVANARAFATISV